MASKGGLEEVPEGMIYFIFFATFERVCWVYVSFSGDDITGCAL
jgi:hypothetical protein